MICKGSRVGVSVSPSQVTSLNKHPPFGWLKKPALAGWFRTGRKQNEAQAGHHPRIRYFTRILLRIKYAAGGHKWKKGYPATSPSPVLRVPTWFWRLLVAWPRLHHVTCSCLAYSTPLGEMPINLGLYHFSFTLLFGAVSFSSLLFRGEIRHAAAVCHTRFQK